VAHEPSQGAEQVRAAEVIGALCLATDLGMGFPFEHGLRSTLVATRLADRLGVDPATASQAYYACLLSHAGCTTDAHVTAEVFGDSLTTHLNPVLYGSQREVLTGLIRALPEPESPAPVRALQVARGLPRIARLQRPHFTAMCEVAQMLADGVGLPSSIAGLLAHLTERWDGKGPLRRAKGEEIPLPMRIVHVAVDATFQRWLGGVERAARLASERAGGGLDPEVAACFADDAEEILALDPEASAWDEVLACEPEPRPTLEGDAIDRALSSMGGFADLISPYLTGHSAGVAELAAAAAKRCRLDATRATTVRRAALVHDLGRVAIGARTWQRAGPLTVGEWEQVRLHPYQTERVISRSPFLSALAPVAGAHHERLDGSGYHRGSSAAELALPARLLAAADAFHAMCEPRPHREPVAPKRAAEDLGREASAGRLDPDAVTAVVEAAGERVPRLERPAGLTEREAEVLGMLARGLQTKQVARGLGISVKTADSHIQHAYRKVGVSTRAAATLFAMEHGLLAWGELPIARTARRAQSSARLYNRGSHSQAGRTRLRPDAR
jgi:HD-GYP domain-containing protein (c-di-GMP phosphodiesterase class II)